jgi:hypothetical protein
MGGAAAGGRAAKSLGERIFGSVFDDEDEGGADDLAEEQAEATVEKEARRQETADKPEKKKAPPRPAPARPAPASRRRLKARVVLSADGELILEITIAGGEVKWTPIAPTHVELADGRRLLAGVDGTRSTRALTLTDGQVARLALALPKGTPRPVRVIIDLPGGAVEVEVPA